MSAELEQCVWFFRGEDVGETVRCLVRMKVAMRTCIITG